MNNDCRNSPLQKSKPKSVRYKKFDYIVQCNIFKYGFQQIRKLAKK